MTGGVAICVEVDPSRIRRRLETRYLDVEAPRLDHALELADGRATDAAEHRPVRQLRRRRPRAASPRRADRHRDRPDQRPRPARLRALAASPSRTGPRRARARTRPTAPASRWPATSRRWSASRTRGAEVFDYGNSIRAEAQLGGYERAFDFPGFVPAYIRPLFCEGKGPFRWAALSGDPRTSPPPTRPCSTSSRRTSRSPAGSSMAAREGPVPGPARRASAGSARASATSPACAFNDLVAERRGRRADRHRPRPPRLRLGRLALPRDRGDARRLRRDRRLAAAERDGQRRLRRVLGLDPPRRRRRHRPLDPRRPGVASPTARELAAQKLERVLTNDPATGVIRHVDAGYDRAEEVAAERGVRVRPMPKASGGSEAPPLYFADYAWLGGDEVAADVRIEVAGERIAAVHAGRRARRRAAARGDAARPRQRALARVPAGAARAHASRRRQLLDVARGHVRARGDGSRPTTTYALARGDLPRDGAGPASPGGRVRLRPPQRGADRRPRDGGRHPAHAARRLLRRRRLRRAAQPASSSASATATPRAGPSASAEIKRREGRRRDPLRPRRPRGPARDRGGVRPTAGRCTSTSPSSAPRTRPASPAHGVTPGRSCWPSTARSGPNAPPSTPPTSPTGSPASARRRSACARRPSATSPTASAAPARALVARQRQPRGHRPLRGGPRGRAQPPPDDRDAAATSRPPTSCARATNHACLGWQDAGVIATGRPGRPRHRLLDSSASPAPPRTMLEPRLRGDARRPQRDRCRRHDRQGRRHTTIDVPHDLATT